MTRSDWLNLNGLWDYVVCPDSVELPVFEEASQILVPFAIESALSGVARALLPGERLWYRRWFTVPESWRGQRTLLHFGAVDFEAEVFVGGHRVGSHEGGFLPFSFDITACLDESEGRETELVVAVHDGTNRERGKQSLHPAEIFYTAVSGIWQTVWIEPVPETHIRALAITPSFRDATFTVATDVDGPLPRDAALEVVVSPTGAEVVRATGKPDTALTLHIPDARAWSPDDPFLYDFTVRLVDENAETIDEVQSYAGLRSFSVERAPDGYQRIFLNGAPAVQSGLLDQGYWPDGLYTAPTDDALAFDVTIAKRLGFTMLRKHMKVEPARWYYHCDRLGLIVWQDMPASGPFPQDTRGGRRLWAIGRALGRIGIDAWGPIGAQFFRHVAWKAPKIGAEDESRTATERACFERQLHDMVDTLRNVTCIAGWVPFNEGWGQWDAERISHDVATQDPTRLVDHASGWFDLLIGDFVSYHDYGMPPKLPARTRVHGRAIALSEFGGMNFPVPGHVWQAAGKPALYRVYPSTDRFQAAYSRVFTALAAQARAGLSLAVYTQLTDVELELNGVMTYDREVVKVDEVQSRYLNAAFIDAGDEAPQSDRQR